MNKLSFFLFPLFIFSLEAQEIQTSVIFARDNLGSKRIGSAQIGNMLLVNTGLRIQETNAAPLDSFDLSTAESFELISPTPTANCPLDEVTGRVQNSGSDSVLSLRFSGSAIDCSDLHEQILDQQIELKLYNIPINSDPRNIAETFLIEFLENAR